MNDLCPHCSAPLVSGDQFCASCGQSLNHPSLKPMPSSNVRQQVAVETRCEQCGDSLAANTSACPRCAPLSAPAITRRACADDLSHKNRNRNGLAPVALSGFLLAAAVVAIFVTVNALSRNPHFQTENRCSNVTGVMVAVTRDGKFLATLDSDIARFDTRQFRRAKIWNTDTGEVVQTVQGASGIVRCAAFSPDGRFLVTGGDEEVATLWETGTGRIVRTFGGQTTLRGIMRVAYSPDGRNIVTVGGERLATLWDADTVQERFTLPAQANIHGVACVAFSSDGKYLLTGGTDTPPLLWDAATGSLVKSLLLHSAIINRSLGSSHITCSFDNRNALIAGTDTGPITWDIQTGERVMRLTPGGRDIIYASFSPDNRFLVSIGSEAAVYDAGSGRLIQTLNANTHGRSIAFLGDSRHIIADVGGRIMVWKLD